MLKYYMEIVYLYRYNSTILYALFCAQSYMASVRSLNSIRGCNFQAVTFSNLYAPEHLIINVEDAEKWESFIENAGKCHVDTSFVTFTPSRLQIYVSCQNAQ